MPGEWITQYAFVDEMMQEIAINTIDHHHTVDNTLHTHTHTQALVPNISRVRVCGEGISIPYIPQLLLLVEPLFSAVYAAFALHACIAIYPMVLHSR